MTEWVVQSIGALMLICGVALVFPLGWALIIVGATLLAGSIGAEVSRGGARGSRKPVRSSAVDDDE